MSDLRTMFAAGLRHSRRWSVPILLVAGLGAAGPVLAQDRGPALPSGTPVAEEAPAVRAQLSPRHSTVLSSQLAGRIAELDVREGDRFTEGQRLVVLDCAVPRAKLAKAQAAREGARQTAQVKRRLQDLNSVSSLEVGVAQADAAQADAEVAVMTALLNYCAVAAPFSGRIAELKVRRHQYVAEGQALMEILDDTELEVEMIVPSRWLGWLRQGSPFAVHIDETGREYPAEVARIGARIDPVSQSVKVFARIKGHYAELLSGMSGTVRFTPPG